MPAKRPFACKESHLRAVRLRGQCLRVAHESLQVKTAVGVAVHHEQAAAVTCSINSVQRPRRPEDFGLFHPNFLESESLARRDHLFCQVMRVRMQAHIANRTRLAGLQIENRSIHHGHERLGHIVRERA